MRESARATATRERRQAILDAALRCFTERGYARTPIEDVRDASGASIGSIYHHFSSKEGIAAALYVDGLGDYQDGALEQLRSRRSTRAAIQGGVRHHLRWVAENADLARFLLAGREAEVALASERPLRERNRRFFGEVIAWVRERTERGELRSLSPPTVFYALWIGPSQELSRHWLAGRVRMRLEDAAPALAEAAWNSLKPKED